MALDRLRDWYWMGEKPENFEGVYEYIQKHYAEHQEESASRISDFNILRLSQVPWIDVRKHGAKADGSTDDTKAIQAAIDEAEAADGVGKVYIPAGHYKFTTLVLQKETAIVGAGPTSSSSSYGTYLETTATSGSAISLTGAASADRKRIVLEGFTLVGNSDLDKGIDISSSATVIVAYVDIRNVEIRTITKATGYGIYLLDASHVNMSNVVVRNGTLSGYGLVLDSVNWNGGPVTATNCDFGNQGESVAGLYYKATANHYGNTKFISCYFGGGSAGGGNAVLLDDNTPTGMFFDCCGFECENTQANGAAIKIDCNTNNLRFSNCNVVGLDEADRGFDFNSGTHNGLVIESVRFDDIDAGGVCIYDNGCTYTDTKIIGLSRNNAETGWTGTFASSLRNGFGQSTWIFGDGTNNMTVQPDGEINLAGTAKVTRHLRVGAGSWKNGASAPSPGLWGIFTTLDFDTDSDDDAHYTLIVPHRWDGTTDIKIVVDWAHEVASVAGVTWALEYKGIKAGEAIAGGTATLTEPSGASVINVMQRTVFDPCIDADLLEAEDTLALRLYRDVSDAGDTLPGDARLLNVHFHFTMDKLGEATT